MISPDDAATALEGARAARVQLAERLRCPPYMHAVFGALLGGLVASEGAPDRITLMIEGFVAAVAVIIFITQRHRLGFFINGYRRGRMRPVILAVIGAYLLLFSLAAFLKIADGLHWPALGLGVLMSGLGAWGSLEWQRRYQAEMAGPLAP